LEAEPVLTAASTEHDLTAELREEEQPDIFSVPLTVDAEPSPMQAEADPLVVSTEEPAEEVARDVLDALLFAEPAYEPRRPRGGFLSIFGGRPRYETPVAPAVPAPISRTAPAPSRGGAMPAESAAPAEAVDQNEDLEIPSFLRRLAN